jgi:hypothetical protein
MIIRRTVPLLPLLSLRRLLFARFSLLWTASFPFLTLFPAKKLRGQAGEFEFVYPTGRLLGRFAHGGPCHHPDWRTVGSNGEQQRRRQRSSSCVRVSWGRRKQVMQPG